MLLFYYSYDFISWAVTRTPRKCTFLLFNMHWIYPMHRWCSCVGELRFTMHTINKRIRRESPKIRSAVTHLTQISLNAFECWMRTKFECCEHTHWRSPVVCVCVYRFSVMLHALTHQSQWPPDVHAWLTRAREPAKNFALVRTIRTVNLLLGRF